MLLAAEQAPAQIFITESDLMTRLPEKGVAIDPDNPSEIDDAIWVEPFHSKRGLFRIQVHVADGGLLYGNDLAIAQARTKGWSIYYEDGQPPDLMLDEAIAVQGLSLNVSHHNTGYAPATTVAFTFDNNNRRILDPKIYKSRVAVRALGYDKFEQNVKKARNGKASHDQHTDRLIYLRARELTLGPGKARSFYPGTIGSLTVQNYMVVANSLIASNSQENGRPWLFRNHHLRGFEHPQDELISHLYPETARFKKRRMAWYSRIPTVHANLGMQYCHFTSPLRRFPDLVNHLNLHADLEGLALPYDNEAIDEIAREMGQKIIKALSELRATEST